MTHPQTALIALLEGCDAPEAVLRRLREHELIVTSATDDAVLSHIASAFESSPQNF